MVTTKKISNFSIDELKIFKREIQRASSKEELLDTIDKIIKNKENNLALSLNERFPVTQFNIDPDYISLLHNNGIYNLAQLRNIKEDDLHLLKGMTKGGFAQISWARDFFDMTPFEGIKTNELSTMTIVKMVVKQANECSKKHPNV